MANTNCEACESLRQTAPSLIVNGLDDDMCLSLQNDTGLNPSDDHTDCEDLNNLNDCLVGNMEDEVDLYAVCDWKPFMKKFIPNLWTTLKGIICAICGIWTNIHSLWMASYMGIITLYVNSNKTNSSGTQKKQVLNFDKAVNQGNLPSGVLKANTNKNGIIVTNTTEVPLLIESTINVSQRTSQHMASCYLTVSRDGTTIGQTPFITPTTYDQQCEAEAFILEPGESTTLTYYFGVGDANSTTWFKNLFYPNGSEDVKLCLEPNIASNPENQQSYFTVRATGVSMGGIN